MPIHVALHHRTHYTYDRLVNHAPHVVRLRPAPHSRTTILSFALRILPARHFINWQQDPQSNYLARLVFPEPARELLVEVDLVAEMSVYNPFDFFLEPQAERFPFNYDPVLDHELAPFRLAWPTGPRFKAYADQLRAEVLNSPPSPRQENTAETQPGQRTVDCLVALNRRVQRDVQYLIRLEPGVQTPEETLEKGSGSCRDSAWLLCQVLRHFGLAARFVSGYLIQLTPDVKALDGPSGPAQDFTDLHAWTEVYLPGAGWIGLDPTSGLLAGEGHIPLACTPDPSSAAPITGAVDPCEATFHHEMRVTRIHESPRVTKPYTDQDWEAICSLGDKVDTELEQSDVQLTMGGEPTFVSIDDMEGAEWNTSALGPTKRQQAGILIKKLRRRFAPQGLLFYGQGKWYPGESLPRWALACYWRKDGHPVWHDDALIADETRDGGHGLEESRQFMDELIARLGVEPQWLLPAYEDVWYYLWKERRLPVNVDPLQSNLADKEEADRIARIFQHGLGKAVGLVLPLRRDHQSSEATWRSGPWFLRDETLWLIPGDSPMGFRLPLDSLPWVSENDYPWIHPIDPSQHLPPLPRTKQPFLSSPALRSRSQSWRLDPAASPMVRESTVSQSATDCSISSGQDDPSRRPSFKESAAWIIRTALCVEPRHGRLHVFMPPLESTEHYLELVQAIENSARTTGLPVILEGAPPPHDPRLNVLKVTPDPGVIEVNLHPAHSWKELVHHTSVLYDEARQTRLGTEKFMLDGRHTGTGGGNHIVIGGPSPSQSPLLRRPDLLRSLVGFWHNHPSLSYLFSGLFLGPTSQHPRVDEARNDSLYELEVAFRQFPASSPTSPWLVDRLLRHILIDVTGNTHRAEFSIDKLYSPDTATGRLGLVELRSFEMPPHPRMSLAQHLLLRALIARFWKHPYDQTLVRWGTELHDRFMLPHFVQEDFADVLDDLHEHEYPCPLSWFAPHIEFRFPCLGTLDRRGVRLELRHALEPWHVLGEEAGSGSTVRYVDSSVERLQVKVQGLVNSRHIITCNGRRVPLHPTGTNGEFVAGVRYRAWQPPSCLHPTIPVHSPLGFDIFDTWNNRSLGGCTYHVAHPGGRNYSTFPVNAYEAESRRLARFTVTGHTPGPMAIPVAESNPDFPFTLDLRRPTPGI